MTITKDELDLPDLVEDAKPVGVEEPEKSGSILTPAELEKIRQEAKKNVEKEIHKAAVAKAMGEAELQAKIEAGLMPEQGPPPVKEEELVSIRINVPKYVPFIRIDRQRFYHGFSYNVPVEQALYLTDQMQHCWRQELQTKGEWIGPGHRAQNINIDQHGNVINRAGNFH